MLVVVQLDGGNDGINTVVPYGDDGYAKARVKLRLETRDLHKLNDLVALHPQMRSAKSLFDDGRLAIVQGVGYPNPDRSHFRSMRIWQTASMEDDAHNAYGWLGQALDGNTVQRASGEAAAIYVGEDQTPVALWGRRSAATALSRIDDLTLQGDFDRQKAPTSPMESVSTGDDTAQQFVSRQVVSAFAAAEQFRQQELAHKQGRSVNYPDNALGARLELVSRLLKSGSQATGFLHVARGLRHACFAIADSRQIARRVVVVAQGVFGRPEGSGARRSCAGPGVQRIRPPR